MLWDGREPNPIIGGLTASLDQPVMDAIISHAEATGPPTRAQVDDIVTFDLGLCSAQRTDLNAGTLNAGGRAGAPENLLGPTISLDFLI